MDRQKGLPEVGNVGWNMITDFRALVLVDRIANCKNLISRWRKKNVLPGKVNISALKEALDEVKKDDTISQEEIKGITKKLLEAYKEEETYWRQKS